MKKWIVVEIVALIALLLVAIFLCIKLALPTPTAPPNAETTTAPTEGPVTDPTEQTEATEPPETTWGLPEESSTWVSTAKQYFVYDCDTDTFTVSSGSAGERVYPASITKLFTAYVAMQYLEPETILTVGDEMDLVAWGSSVAELTRGDQLSAEMLVEAMLLPSGNDAAYTLAAAAGRMIAQQPNISASNAVKAFMTEMNRQAQELGMTSSHFVNPDGIHSSEHYMSFSDLALLGKLSIDNPSVLKNAKISRDIIDLKDGPVVWKNTNELTNPISQFYCPYAVGLKTGQTPSAGSCLLSAFRTEDRTLIIGVFGCPDVDSRFVDTLLLFAQETGL